MKKIKKLLSLCTAFIFAAACLPSNAYGAEAAKLDINKSNISSDVSENFYGITLSNSSFSADAGLVSNLVCNNSFEYSSSPEYAWSFDNISSSLLNTDSLDAANPTYEQLKIDGTGTLSNRGYSEPYKNNTHEYSEKSAEKSSMHLKKDTSYDFSCYMKNVDFTGTVSVCLDTPADKANSVTVNISKLSSSSWDKMTASIKSSSNDDGALKITFDGKGTLLFDFASLTPADAYGSDSDSWKYVNLNQDLFTALKNLSPSYIRFPGGSNTEGEKSSSLYSWKDTIGDVSCRKQIKDLHSSNGDFECFDSGYMGYHEYFQLCEDLNAVAVPAVGAGIACSEADGYDINFDAYSKLSMSNDEFREYLINQRGFDENDDDAINERIKKVENLGYKSESDFDKYLSSISLTPGSAEFDNYVQDILDLIEYANGDSGSTFWGALRSENGHDEPFNLKYLEISSDNTSKLYNENFQAICKAVNEVYPDITIIRAFQGDDMQSGQYAADVINNVSYYESENDLLTKASQLDSLDRESGKIMIGEYACEGDSGKTISRCNMGCAAEEAAFMTAVERNCDAVTMASHSPAVGKLNANDSDNALIWFNSSDIALTPSYYVQMLFSNNTGSKLVSTDFSNENISQSVTVDESSQTLYVKLVNLSQSKQTVAVSLDGFGKINYASNQSISHTYESAYNKIGTQYVAPTDNAIESNGTSLEIKLEKNSSNVIRIAYGDNNGNTLYKLPDDIDLSVKKYLPTGAKIIVGVICLSLPVGSVAGYLLYTKVLSKSSGGKGKNDKNKKRRRK